jgi:hypothetical protein
MKNPNGPSIEEMDDWNDELRDREAERSSGAAQGYAVVGTRMKDGKEERFRTPRNPSQWYRHPVADKMLAVMTQAHPSWQWQIEHEPHNDQAEPSARSD